MSSLTESERANNLRKFFSAAINTVTRERIFFHRLLVPPPTSKTRGRPPTTPQIAAEAAVNRGNNLSLPRAAFVELKSADGLLALMALRSGEYFAPFSVHQAFGARVQVDNTGEGIVRDDESIEKFGVLRCHMQALEKLLSPRSELKSFNFTSPYSGAVR